MKRTRRVAIHWLDVHAYSGNNLYSSTAAYTEGVLVRKRPTYLLIRNPETIVLDPLRNHPPRRPRFYYIPRALITSATFIN